MSISNIRSLKKDLLLEELQGLDTDMILIIVDSEIQKNYPELLKSFLGIENKKIISFVSSSGESAKTFEEYESAMNFFLEKNIHRNSHLVAIGGGAVTDLGGFVASTLLRGIKWSNIPTTLLGMVDASIGGKTAINSKYGKNLVGAFHLPQNVWICTSFLQTLSSKEFNCGLGEVIKYGMINEEISNLIIAKSENYKVDSNSTIEDIIVACADFKNSIVINDFKEAGLRQILNYGHTFGHAIERHYQITHGEAVFWGMYLICELFGEKKDVENLIKISAAFDHPFTKPPWLHKTLPIQNFLDFIKKDKKKIDDENINLVISSGNCAEIKKYKIGEIEELFINKVNELKKIEIKNN